jgi:hypothetical protein
MIKKIWIIRYSKRYKGCDSVASFNIHLAIGKLYIEKNKIIDVEKFMYGSIAPDLEKDKNKSHYTGIKKDDSASGFLQIKVMLPEFLKANKLDTDYNKGVFLHLLTDYLFYNYFFEEEYLKNITYNEFVENLFYSYDCVSEYLENKYMIENVTIREILKNYIKKQENITRINIIDIKKLDSFIEKVSNIDIDKYAELLIKTGKNILPDEFSIYDILLNAEQI